MGIQERRRKCRQLIERHYAHVPSREDLLDRAISDHLLPSHVLLDAGCGSDLPLLLRYGPKASMAIGIDLELSAARAEGYPHALAGDLAHLPFASGSIDIVISRSVLEHLERPSEVFAEFHRVLRPGGKLIFTTPNKYYYSCLVARAIPEWAKAAYFRRVFGEDAYDHFAVHYRANTPRAFRRLAVAARFRIEKLEALRHYPYYLMFPPLLFRLGILYDRLITALGLDALQSNWLVVMAKE